jgi:hypothetical protein
MAPAQRDEVAALSCCLRTARSLCLGPAPARHRAARSALANEPKNSPTSVMTSVSAQLRCSRVRIRSPVGEATTNGAARVRSGAAERGDEVRDVINRSPA